MKTILFSKSFAAGALGMMLTFGSAAALYSCSDDEFQARVNIPEEKTLTTGLSAQEQVIEFDIESDSEWSIDFDKEGNHIAYVFPRSGSGNAKVKLHVLPNFDEVSRSGNMHINFAKNPSQNRNLTIVQKAKNDGEDNYDENLLGEQSYGLGWGYDTRIGTNATKCLKYPVLMSEFLQKKRIVSKTADSKFSITDRTYTGSTVAELKSDFEAHAEFEGGGLGFNAELNATFNNNDFSNEQYEYAMTYVDVMAERNMITVPAFALSTEDAMVPEAYMLLNDADMFPNGANTYHTIVQYYGTHVIVKSSLGGRLNIGTKVNTSKVTKEYDLKAFAKLSYSGIVETSASVDETFKQTWEENKKSCETNITALGGSAEFKHKIATTKGDEQTENIKEWIADITNNGTGSFIAITDSTDLVPIWKFVKDEQRQKELQKYIESGQYKYPSDNSYFDLGVQGHLSDVSSLIADMNFNNYVGSLVKKITIGDEENKTIALLCSEYIPEINEKGRVAVFYPVINGVTKFNLGLFLGNEYAKPAKVCNYGGKMIIKPMTDRKTFEYKDVYFRGPFISLDKMEDVDDIIETKVSDYTAQLWKNGNAYGYPVVKLCNNIWMRENYASNAIETRSIEYVTRDRGYYYYEEYFYQINLGSGSWKIPKGADLRKLIDISKTYSFNFVDAIMTPGIFGTNFSHSQTGFFTPGPLYWNQNEAVYPVDDRSADTPIYLYPTPSYLRINTKDKTVSVGIMNNSYPIYAPFRYVIPIE